MVNYSALAQNAKALLRRYGRPIVFVKLNEVPADVSKPWNGPSANGETLVTLQGVSLDPIGQRQMGTSSEFSSLVIENTSLLIVANDGNDLSQFTEVIDDNKRFGIYLIESLKPASIPIVSYVWVKR